MTFEQYEPLIHKICSRLRKFGESKGLEYNDLFQIGSLGLLEAMERVEDREDTKTLTYFYKYIYWKVHSGIAPNAERRRFRSGSPEVVFTSEPVTKAVSGEQGRVDDREEIDRVLGMFSEKDREILIAYGEGFGPTELADRLGCSRQNIHRVVNNFRRHWGELIGGGVF